MVAYNHNEHWLPLVLRRGPKPCSATLDVGGGDGRLLARLSEVSDSVVGVDPDLASVPSLNCARK